MVDPDPAEAVRVLYAGDGDDWAATALAEADGFDVAVVPGASAGYDRVVAGRFDCVVSAVELPDGHGVDLLRRVADHRPDAATVLVGDGDDETAVEAVRAGVTDYVRSGDAGRVVDRVRAAVESRREREGILDRMTDAFFALDANWRFTYLNERGRRVICEAADVEATADELLGEDIWDLIPEAVDTPFYERYREAMETGESVVFEERYGPMETWFEVRAYPSTTGLSVYFRDITARKERERERAERERILTRIHRALADKGPSLEAKVEELLTIGREVLGTEYGALSRVEGDDYVFEVVDDPSGAVQPGDVVPLGATNCERAIAEDRTLVLADVAADAPDLAERAGYTEWGIECYVGTPVEVEGEMYGTFCFYDRTARTEPFDDWEVTVVELMGDWISYEKERERRERELERERDRLDSFASMVSHDLRNPLNLATGNLELVAAECESDRVDDVAAALDRMDALIDDMLAVARSGQQVVDPTPVDLAGLAREAWAAAGDANGTLRVEGERTVRGDENRLRQLFENLFRNSVEHSSTGNRPEAGDSVEHSSTSSRAEPDDSVEHSSTGNRPEAGDSVEGGSTDDPEPARGVTVTVGTLEDGFYVEDDGPGIPEDERERVFRSGYSTRADGTGFGLSIVAAVVEAHGWEIAVTEGVDGGARFEVTGLGRR